MGGGPLRNGNKGASHNPQDYLSFLGVSRRAVGLVGCVGKVKSIDGMYVPRAPRTGQGQHVTRFNMAVL